MYSCSSYIVILYKVNSLVLICHNRMYIWRSHEARARAPPGHNSTVLDNKQTVHGRAVGAKEIFPTL